jgi:hypothetical protein
MDVTKPDGFRANRREAFSFNRSLFVLQFGVQSLVNWQAWAVFAVSVIYLLGWKKDAV